MNPHNHCCELYILHYITDSVTLCDGIHLEKLTPVILVDIL